MAGSALCSLPEGISEKVVACENRIAHNVSIAARDIAIVGGIASDAVPGGDGYAWINVSGLTPSSIRVSADVSFGNIGVTCVADGETVPARLRPGEHAFAKFDVDVPESGDTYCTFYLYGTPGDIGYLGIIESTSEPVERDDTGEVAGEITSLPNTGSGNSIADDQSRMPEMLLVFAMTALLCSLTRFWSKQTS